VETAGGIAGASTSTISAMLPVTTSRRGIHCCWEPRTKTSLTLGMPPGTGGENKQTIAKGHLAVLAHQGVIVNGTDSAFDLHVRRIPQCHHHLKADEVFRHDGRLV
jgi:hypothetical protein